MGVYFVVELYVCKTYISVTDEIRATLMILTMTIVQ